jgi:hypothetical protein
MGIGMKFSDAPCVASTPLSAVSPNPHPYRYSLVKSERRGSYTAVMLKYHGCTTHKGRKVSVYARDVIPEVNFGSPLDPHFIDGSSPVARFPGTNEGWSMAIRFMDCLAQ